MMTTANGSSSDEKTGTQSAKAALAKKQSNKRVKWADHFGDNLAKTKEIEGENTLGDGGPNGNVSWSDRKKRDRLREKELLAKAK
jgi:hypothetical protein